MKRAAGQEPDKGAIDTNILQILARFIAAVVGGWDSATLTARLELRIGKDLQYIRINGTLVGFLAGGALHLVLQYLFKGH